jgi:hypothetical protein
MMTAGEDQEAFRCWTDSDEFPDEGTIWWLRGEIWIDLSPEQIFTHVRAKTEFTAVLEELAGEQQRGYYFGPGARLSNVAADFSCLPDGVFYFSETTLGSGRIRHRVGLIEDTDREGYHDLLGTPDLVLEVVSSTTEQREVVELRRAYWEAGIPEYWIVDVRNEALRFDILRRTVRGYSNSRKQGGWVKSVVFDKSFRLLMRADEFGDPEYTLQVR